MLNFCSYSFIISLLQSHDLCSPFLGFFNLLPCAHLLLFEQCNSICQQLGIFFNPDTNQKQFKMVAYLLTPFFPSQQDVHFCLQGSLVDQVMCRVMNEKTHSLQSCLICWHLQHFHFLERYLFREILSRRQHSCFGLSF